MTIQELYDWAKENNMINADIFIRDELYGSCRVNTIHTGENYIELINTCKKLWKKEH